MKLGKLNYSGYRNQIHRNLCHRNKIRRLWIIKLDFSVPQTMTVINYNKK